MSDDGSAATVGEACPGDGRHFCIQTKRLDHMEVRDAKILKSLDDMSKRQEESNVHIIKELASIGTRIGVPPDPTSGNEGSGMSKILFAIQNLQQKHVYQISDLYSRIDDVKDEAEVTKNQSREEIVARAKKAESELNTFRRNKRAHTVLLVKTISGLFAAVLTGGCGLAIIQYLLK